MSLVLEPTVSLGVLTAQSDVSIAASGSYVHIIWYESGTVRYIRSSDAGTTFSSPVPLATSIQGGCKVYASGANVYIVWQQNNDIMFIRSGDNGSAFSPAINISNTSGASTSPQVAASGSTVCITWIDSTSGKNDVLFRTSTSSGVSFSGILNITASMSPLSHTDASSPAVAVDGFKVYVAFDDRASSLSQYREIWLARSTDGGTTFATPQNISATGAADSKDVAIAASGSNFYASWADFNTAFNAFQIFYKRSIDGGSTFPTYLALTSVPNNSAKSVLGIGASGRVYLMYSHYPYGNADLYLDVSTDGGKVFSTTWLGITNTTFVDSKSGVMATITDGVVDRLYMAWIEGSGVLKFRRANYGTVAPPPPPPTDTTSPYVAITQVPNAAHVELPYSFNLIGTASDNVGVVRVEVTLDSEPPVIAQGTTSWSAPLTVETFGKHLLKAKAFDAAGNTYTASRGFAVGPLANISFGTVAALGLAAVFLAGL